MKRLRTVVITITIGLCAMASCTSTPSPSTASPTTRHDVLRLLESAEAAHHCAGEEATDDTRRAELSTCVDDNLRTARGLLPSIVASSSMQPGSLAVVRLYVEPALSPAERQQLCAQVPAADVLDGLLDDEARAGCGLPSP